MKTFEFEISETLCRIVQVNAESLPEAYEKVNEMYRNEEIVLDAGDYQHTDIHPTDCKSLN